MADNSKCDTAPGSNGSKCSVNIAQMLLSDATVLHKGVLVSNCLFLFVFRFFWPDTCRVGTTIKLTNCEGQLMIQIASVYQQNKLFLIFLRKGRGSRGRCRGSRGKGRGKGRGSLMKLFFCVHVHT